MSGQELNMKFISGLHASFRSYASKMGEYISNLVNILVSWYVFFEIWLAIHDENEMP